MFPAPCDEPAMMASASTPRDTLAGELHEFGDVEWSEVVHPATNNYWPGASTFLHDQFFGHPATNNVCWTGAPTCLHGQFFGPLAFMAPPTFMGSMGALQIQYVRRPDSIFIQIAGGQRAFAHDDDESSVDARERIVEYDDESDEADTGDGTASAEQGDIDNGFLSGEEESESEDDSAYEISTDPARIPRPESDDDELLEEAGDDESGVFNGAISTESESEQDDADDDSGESESDESDSNGASEDSNSGSGESGDGDEDDCRDELEEEDAQEQDASGEDDDESGDENDQWVTPNPLKRGRTPDSGDEEDEPPHKTSRVLIVKSFEGNVLGTVFHNGIRILLS